MRKGACPLSAKNGRRDIVVQFFQSLVNGISIGCSYTLMGLGLTVIYSVYHILNMAHGEYYMLGAFAAYFCMNLAGMPYALAAIASIFITGLIGILTEVLIFRRIQFRSENDQVVATIGLYFFIENFCLWLWTANVRPLLSPFPTSMVLNIGGVVLSAHRILVIVVTVILIILMQIFYSKAKLGKQMRAVSQDRVAAQLMGINIKKVGMAAFFLACAFASIAGTLMGSLREVSPVMGMSPLLSAVVVVILGGMGSNMGAIVGGLLLGIVENLVMTYATKIVSPPAASAWSRISIFIILFVILMIKPNGLFGGKKNA